jgi:hypothetical protein
MYRCRSSDIPKICEPRARSDMENRPMLLQNFCRVKTCAESQHYQCMDVAIDPTRYTPTARLLRCKGRPTACCARRKYDLLLLFLDGVTIGVKFFPNLVGSSRYRPIPSRLLPSPPFPSVPLRSPPLTSSPVRSHPPGLPLMASVSEPKKNFLNRSCS